MKPLVFSLGGAASLTERHHACLFQITALGGRAGPVGQIPDGQCRTGGKWAHSSFSLDKVGGIMTDSQGRGCYITSEANQLQCDWGKVGTFSLRLTIPSNC